MSTKILPLVHLNGSGLRNLLPPAEEAHAAVQAAYLALRGMAPHGRDYYPLAEGAYDEAAAEYKALATKLMEVQEAIEAHLQHLYEAQAQIDARKLP